MSVQILPSLSEPIIGERPTEFADRIGRSHSMITPETHKKSLGQYLTPIAVADYMASRIDREKAEYRILDPGAGSGVLACAIAERVSQEGCRTKRVRIDAYECDDGLLPLLNRSLEYLESHLSLRGVTLEFRVISADFVVEHSEALRSDESLFHIEREHPAYDIVIANPPYFKLAKSDPRALAGSRVVHGQPNIYALFMAVSASLLKPEGELVFITPRSFTSGSYFRKFREHLFAKLQLEAIHVFESRRDAFCRDSILQENVILKGKRLLDRNETNVKSMVKISVSRGATDMASCEEREVSISDLLDLNSKEKMLRISSSQREDEVVKCVDKWKGSLGTYGMQASTGPVVPFRAVDQLSHHGSLPDTHAPLLWLQNIRQMEVEWPTSARNKPQYISIDSRESLPLLVRNRNYVVLRRFSAKEERRRLIAAPLLEGQFCGEWIGIENHLNYIHRPGDALSKEEAIGLATIYNSVFMDTYFRVLNGSTQVSATELRRMPLPPLELIEEIGSRVMRGEINHTSDEALANVAFANHYSAL